MDWNWIYAYQLRLRNHRRTVDKGTFRFKVHPWICCDRTQQCWWMCRTSPRFDQRSSVHFNECWIFRSAQTSQALFVFFAFRCAVAFWNCLTPYLNLLQHLFFLWIFIQNVGVGARNPEACTKGFEIHPLDPWWLCSSAEPGSYGLVGKLPNFSSSFIMIPSILYFCFFLDDKSVKTPSNPENNWKTCRECVRM